MRPNKAAFCTLIKVLRENGALGDAMRVYEGMRKCGHAPSREFQQLTAAAAEQALSQEDQDLLDQVGGCPCL